MPLPTPEEMALRVMPPVGLILSPTELRERLAEAFVADREAMREAVNALPSDVLDREPRGSTVASMVRVVALDDVLALLGGAS